MKIWTKADVQNRAIDLEGSASELANALVAVAHVHIAVLAKIKELAERAVHGAQRRKPQEAPR